MLLFSLSKGLSIAKSLGLSWGKDSLQYKMFQTSYILDTIYQQYIMHRMYNVTQNYYIPMWVSSCISSKSYRIHIPVCYYGCYFNVHIVMLCQSIQRDTHALPHFNGWHKKRYIENSSNIVTSFYKAIYSLLKYYTN